MEAIGPQRVYSFDHVAINAHSCRIIISQIYLFINIGQNYKVSCRGYAPDRNLEIQQYLEYTHVNFGSVKLVYVFESIDLDWVNPHLQNI